jgi:hypothetical protein
LDQQRRNWLSKKHWQGAWHGRLGGLGWWPGPRGDVGSASSLSLVLDGAMSVPFLGDGASDGDPFVGGFCGAGFVAARFCLASWRRGSGGGAFSTTDWGWGWAGGNRLGRRAGADEDMFILAWFSNFSIGST